MKLLLVEDDPSMQATLQRTLSRRGMDVTCCADGRLALAAWQASQPDVVMLDLTLPGLDGLQVLEQARRAGLATPVRCRRTPRRQPVDSRLIVLLTASR